MTDDDGLRALAREAGIETAWRTYADEPREVAVETMRAVLSALGLPCGSAADIAESREFLAPKPGLVGLAPLITATEGTPTRLAIGENHGRWATLLEESGGERELRSRSYRDGVELPAISEVGYHRLVIGSREIVLAVAPARALSATELTGKPRPWGLAAQIYGLRRDGDGGIGDAEAVGLLAESAARSGADMLALSPVHALFLAEPHRYGPYSPSSRLFLNPLHAAPAMLFGADFVAAVVAEAGVAETQARLEKLALIDWPAATAARLAVLRTLFGRFSASDVTDALHIDFARFRADGGDPLAGHACFEALRTERLARDPNGGDWRAWPVDLRDPHGPAVAAFASANRHEVLFHMFLQWLADRSLGAAQRRARAAGMGIGLVADLAVGMDPSGGHAWSRPDDVLNGLTIGAPPDLINRSGQQWGITSFSPHALRRGGFAPFLATLRAALRNTGGVRIDHAMGLQRLWLVPDGASPADGAYLNYPVADMLRLLALESHRHRAVVVGEDLGTVPAGFHDAFDRHGVHGMRVLWFERDARAFTPPAKWDRSAMAMTSTHDLPTLAGWWRGADIALRTEHGLLGPGQFREQLEAEREDDRVALWHAITRSGAARGRPPEDDADFVDAALLHTAKAPCALCLIPLEDVLGVVDQPNLPGTIDEHPNWRRRTPGEAATLLDADEVGARLDSIRRERG